MSKVLNIEDDYLRELLDFCSKSTVGKLLKRFEILEDKESIKREAKELIYEEYRNLRNLILAYDKGFTITVFNFKTPQEKIDSTSSPK